MSTMTFREMQDGIAQEREQRYALRESRESFAADMATRQVLVGVDGLPLSRRRRRLSYLRDLAEAVTLVSRVYSGQLRMHHLEEAMSTSDFPSLFGDIIDRQLLGYYQEAKYTWTQWCRRRTVPDFRTVNRFAVDGSEAVLTAIKQQAEYPERKLTDSKYSYSVTKYGAIAAFAFEAMQNDDLDALKDIPMRFGKAARRSEEKFATQLHVSSTGPNATFYAAGHANIVTSNPVLSVAGLQTAMIILAGQTDTESEPIAIDSWVLEVPPALEITAQNILNSTQIRLADNGGTSNDLLYTMNWMKQKVKLAVNYYLPIVNTTSGNAAWYVHADPEAGRPAMEMGFLRGHEQPEIFMKLPNAQRVGGASDPMSGSFENDSIEYKIRHIFGGVLMDYRMSCASTGAGS